MYFVEYQKQSDTFEKREEINAYDISFDEFDYLVVAYHDYSEITEYIKGIRTDYEVYKNQVVDIIQFMSNLHYHTTHTSNYKSIALSCGIEYLYAKEDMGIGGNMAAFDTNFSEDLICNYFELVRFGEKSVEGYFHYSEADSGGSGISYEGGSSTEVVKIISFKEYCDSKGIKASDIDYMWIDTEGFEASIILGAPDMLKEKSHYFKNTIQTCTKAKISLKITIKRQAQSSVYS